MKTIKTILEDMKIDEMSDLTIEVINSILSIPTDNEEEIRKYMENVIDYGCQSGIVTDLIYHYQCNDFFKEHFEEIFDIYNEEKENMNLDFELNATNLSYFVYEILMCRIYDEVLSKLEELED